MSAPYLKDRLGALLASATRNGIDFVEVSQSQTVLKVHFLNAVPLAVNLTTATITGGETIAEVEVKPITDVSWSQLNGRPLLTLGVESSGDFSIYTLTLENDGLDPYYSSSKFSFKANCPSDLDCEPPEHECPADDPEKPYIDYLAKDFLSFRQALLDFSAQRYPEWVERSEADFGMMFLEALSAVADDLSYYQDRIQWESRIDTATERRSVTRLARLVDYEPTPATASRVLLQLDVLEGVTSIPTGVGFTGTNAEGQTLYFESGEGLLDTETGRISLETYLVDPRWNRGMLRPYIWDEDQACLSAGSTQMWIEGDDSGIQELLEAGVGSISLLIDTPAVTTADPPVRSVVEIIQAERFEDPIFLTDNLPTPVTRLTWREPLEHDHPLYWTPAQLGDPNAEPLRTVLAGNLVPATHGQRKVETFAIPNAAGVVPQGALPAIVRTGPNDSPEAPTTLYLYSLQNYPLAWLMREDAAAVQTMPHPEIALNQLGGGPEWYWMRSLLNTDLFEAAFTLDASKHSPIAKNPDGSISYEYDGDEGDTIRFGDGVFGEIPDEGGVFEVTYRAGGGDVGNVARDTITGLSTAASELVLNVTNPFAAEGGADAETLDAVRRDAPQAFRAKQYRAVRREDYEKAAATLPWVSRAGTRFRWTGSWLTVFTSADPKDSQTITTDQQLELIDLLNRYRMTGYESYVPAPQYASVDLRVTICACGDAYRGDVEAALLRTLSSRRFVNGQVGFFHPDNFTFGQPLERSVLEAAIENSYGVCGVLSIQYRRRGFTSSFVELPETVYVGSYEIFRVNNDAAKPEHGTLKVYVEGGK